MKDEKKTLVAILKELKKQNSLKYTFTRGVLYGVGFFIGSAVIAVMVLGALAPILSRIDVIRDSYNDGTRVMQLNYTPTEEK